MRTRAHYDEELHQLYQELQSLGEAVKKEIAAAVRAFDQIDLAEAQRIIEADALIDKAHETIEQHVLQIIALQQPVASDLRRLLAALEIASELERIGDYAKRIAKATLRNPAPPQAAPDVPISQLGDLAVAMLITGIDAFIEGSPEKLEQIQQQDDEIDRLEDGVRAQMLALIQREPAAAEWALDRTVVAHTLERVGDRVTNVAEQLVFAARGERVDLNP